MIDDGLFDRFLIDALRVRDRWPRNATPGTVSNTGDTRSLDPDVRRLLERRIREIADGICAAHGATCTVTDTHEIARSVNDGLRARIAADAAPTDVIWQSRGLRAACAAGG